MLCGLHFLLRWEWISSPESNFTKGNLKCIFLHGSKKGIQFLSGKSSAVCHIKENEGNWKSLPEASYKQRVQRFVAWYIVTSPFVLFFFLFPLCTMGNNIILSQPCPPSSSPSLDCCPWLSGAKLNSLPSAAPASSLLQPYSAVSPLMKHSFSAWAKTYIHPLTSDPEPPSFLGSIVSGFFQNHRHWADSLSRPIILGSARNSHELKNQLKVVLEPLFIIKTNISATKWKHIGYRGNSDIFTYKSKSLNIVVRGNAEVQQVCPKTIICHPRNRIYFQKQTKTP